MTDPADRLLEERLHALARGVSVPVVPADDDVRRGRRRLFRMRVAMAGATTATLAVVLGVTSLTAGDPKATEPPPVDAAADLVARDADARPPAHRAVHLGPGQGQGRRRHPQPRVWPVTPPPSDSDEADVPAKGATSGPPTGTATQGGGTDPGPAP